MLADGYRIAGRAGPPAKAREFLTAAENAASQDLYNAATSNAVVSGINSKDAICLRLTGTTTKGDDHKMAVAELKSRHLLGSITVTCIETITLTA